MIYTEEKVVTHQLPGYLRSPIGQAISVIDTLRLQVSDGLAGVVLTDALAEHHDGVGGVDVARNVDISHGLHAIRTHPGLVLHQDRFVVSHAFHHQGHQLCEVRVLTFRQRGKSLLNSSYGRLHLPSENSLICR